MGRNTKLSCMQEAAFGGNGSLTVSLISTGKEGIIYITICMLKFTVLHQVIDLFNHNFKDSVGIQKICFSNIQLAIHILGFSPFSEGLDID